MIYTGIWFIHSLIRTCFIVIWPIKISYLIYNLIVNKFRYLFIIQYRGPSMSLDLQLPVQSLPTTTNVVSLNPFHGKVYSIQRYCDLQQVLLLPCYTCINWFSFFNRWSYCHQLIYTKWPVMMQNFYVYFSQTRPLISLLW